MLASRRSWATSFYYGCIAGFVGRVATSWSAKGIASTLLLLCGWWSWPIPLSSFLGRMEELRVNKDTHFNGLIQLAKAILQPVGVSWFYRTDASVCEIFL